MGISKPALCVLIAVVCATCSARQRGTPSRRQQRRFRNMSPEAPRSTLSSPSSLWPLPANTSTPPNTVPCTWSPLLTDAFLPGCAGGGSSCSSFATLELAQAACAADYSCGGVTSQPGGVAPWETRAGSKPSPSPSGELSYIITNDCHSSRGLCFALPPNFTISANGFSDAVLDRAMARYVSIINTAYANTISMPPDAPTIDQLIVTVASANDTLSFGVDESYTLNVSSYGGAALLYAETVWGALRGLETMSQLAHHTWTTDASGAVNASFNEVCAVVVIDAPRFPFRGLMLDTARHFLPVSVIKQVLDLTPRRRITVSYLKMNALRLHLVDTDAWSYYIPGLPIVSNTSAYSPLHVYYPSDLSELVEWGRDRGIIVYPEIILESIPELGCLSPPPNANRQFIDPLYSNLWPTMDAIFAGLNAVFPPEYPFHMGGDEVDRNAWAECPSVIAWGAALGIAPADLPQAVADWWYTSLYNFLAAPPFSRTVMAWEDASDAVNGSWVGASAGGLVLEQWNGDPGVWNWDTCSLLKTNASVLVAGPFHDVIGTGPSYNSNPEQNYADIFNLTCSITPRIAQQLVGPELMFWDDAADISASDIVLMLMSSVVPVAESGWSQQAVVSSGNIDAARYTDLRCRLVRRGMQSHDAYGHVSTFCIPEYDAQLMPWSISPLVEAGIV